MTFMQEPGASSRDAEFRISQFPQRDEAAMNEHEPEPGFSNTEPVAAAAEDVTPDVQTPDEPEPGFSNGMAVKAEEAPEEPAEDPEADKPAKKTTKAAAKPAARKKG